MSKKEKITSILLNGSDNFIEVGQTGEKFKDLKKGTLGMWYRPADNESRPQQLIWRGSTLSFQMGIGNWVDSLEDESLIIGIYRNGQPELEFYIRRGNNFFTDNHWYHISFIVGENYNKLFINGVEQNATYTKGSAQTGNLFLQHEEGVDDTIYFGKRLLDGNPHLFTAGYIDEICILDQPLSNWDVKKLYDYGRKIDLRLEHGQNLLAYWRISETQNLPAIEDLSGNEQHGTLKGTTDENTLLIKDVNTLYFKDGDGNELPLSDTSEGGSFRSLWGEKGDNIYFDTGHIGIGTSEPNATLHIAGGNNAGLRIETDNQSPWSFIIQNKTAPTRGLEIYQADNGVSHIWNNYSNGAHISLSPSGKVGIGTADPKADLHVEGQLLGAARDMWNRSLRVCCGRTSGGHTDWKPHGATGIYLDVSISECGFTDAPYLVCSLHGTGGHWSTTGGSNPYYISKDNFRIYVRFDGGGGLSPAYANQYHWHIHWIAIGK